MRSHIMHQKSLILLWWGMKYYLALRVVFLLLWFSGSGSSSGREQNKCHDMLMLMLLLGGPGERQSRVKKLSWFQDQPKKTFLLNSLIKKSCGGQTKKIKQKKRPLMSPAITALIPFFQFSNSIVIHCPHKSTFPYDHLGWLLRQILSSHNAYE